MRVHILFSIILLFFQIYSNANALELKISFIEDDYEICEDGDYVSIIARDGKHVNLYGERMPALPFMIFKYAIDCELDYVSSDVKVSKRLLKSNIKIKFNPKHIPVNVLLQPYKTTVEDSCVSKVYPESNFRYVYSSRWDNVNILHFVGCPFEYDAVNGNLYFIDSLTAVINLDKTNDGIHSVGECPDYILNTINNKAYCKTVDKSESAEDRINDKDKVDYLIVTNRDLQDAFGNLLKWKKRKGLKVAIVTIEDISNMYPGLSTPLQIKTFLYEKFRDCNLKYVLLGGDDKIIPSMKCYCKANGIEYDSMPVDLYYSCFGGAFDWDGNANGIFGEKDDNISLVSSIYLSRVPVRSRNDAVDYISKVIDYELNP